MRAAHKSFPTPFEDERAERKDTQTAARGPEGPPRLQRFGASAIFEDLPPVPWIVEALQITSGRPCIVAAPGGHGKTIFVQSLALHVATGLRLFGQFTTRPGRVLHFDYDQGGRATRHRYRRLALGLGIEQGALEGRLEFIVRPPLYLTSNDAEARVAREVEGADLVIIDSFRGAAGGIDENDSRAREPLDLLARVSEKTGAAFLVLHHSGKVSRDDGPGKSPMRGSSALEDASGAVIALVGEGHDPKRVSIRRDSQDYEGGAPLDPFFLAYRTEVQADGLAIFVDYRTSEQANPPKSRGNDLEALAARVLEVLEKKATEGATRDIIRADLRVRADDVKAAVDLLEGRGAIVERKSPATNRKRLYLASTAEGAHAA